MPQQIRGDRVLLSTTEAKEKSGLSRVHIQRLLRTGRIEGVKLGHDWLVFEDSLMIFISQPRKTGPKPKDSQTDLPQNSSQTSASDEHYTGLSESDTYSSL